MSRETAPGFDLESITLSNGTEIRSGTVLLCRDTMAYGGRGVDDAHIGAGETYEVSSVEWVGSDTGQQRVVVNFIDSAPFDFIDLKAIEGHIEAHEMSVITRSRD